MLTIGTRGPDYETFTYITVNTYTIESSNFPTFVVGYEDDVTRLYVIRADTAAINLRHVGRSRPYH
jgi:hypothetical protein